MYDLTIIKQNGGAYIDSREVAEIIGKQHKNLLRDIAVYIGYMEKSIKLTFEPNDFFLENTYVDPIGRTLPCYLISKMGCEMVANKLTGEKGVLFTAAYVAKFNELEAARQAELDALIECAKKPQPRLGEINACVRIIVRGMKDLGAEPERIIEVIKMAYEPFGISVDADFDFEDDTDADFTPGCWYTAQEIAKKCGLYSLYGKPHAQAASCILNENIFIGREHKRVDAEDYNGYSGVSVRYDNHALAAVVNWLLENGLPVEIYGFGRTYHVQYHMD